MILTLALSKHVIMEKYLQPLLIVLDVLEYVLIMVNVVGSVNVSLKESITWKVGNTEFISSN